MDAREARRLMDELGLREHVAHLVDTAPPLSDEQRRVLRGIFAAATRRDRSPATAVPKGRRRER